MYYKMSACALLNRAFERKIVGYFINIPGIAPCHKRKLVVQVKGDHLDQARFLCTDRDVENVRMLSQSPPGTRPGEPRQWCIENRTPAPSDLPPTGTSPTNEKQCIHLIRLYR